LTILIDGSGFAKAAFVPGQAALCHRFLLRVFKLHEEERGRPITVAWDARDNVSGRRARFPEYKANREHGANVDENGQRVSFGGEEYGEQAAELRSLLPLLGVHQAWSPGWEADDVLGTLARAAEGKVLVLTRDRDMIQLVDGRVTVLLKVGSKEHLLGEQGAEKFLGFSPHVYRDWKALAGDSGDGVPGIPGIGEKTATALVEWRSSLVEDLINGVRMDHLEGSIYSTEQILSLEARVRTAFLKLLEPGARERLELMRWLVSLHEVPIHAHRGRLDLAEARTFFSASGLRLLGARLREWE
jgi:5'-3' exonuclease